MATLVLAQHDNRQLEKATLHAVGAAAQLGSEVHVLILGHDARSVAEAASQIQGVAKVIHADHPAYANPLAEDAARLIVGLAGDYDALLAASSTSGRNVMPRVAALLDIAQVSDVVEILGPDSFKRYVYAGNALATVKTTDTKRALTIRTTAFEPALPSGGSAEIVAHAAPEATKLAEFVGREVTKSERPELTSARIVVSGGRALGSADSFKLVEDLADVLGAAVGASRAAVDAGYKPNDFQVGQTGKVVAPELYIAVGISGAIQHLAGMKDSKVIVAINKDEEAPIFQVADYGLVGDLFKLVPELTETLKRTKS